MAMTSDDIRILDICRDIELLNADIYFYFGELFKGNKAFKELWVKTAMEEQGHANQFSLAAKVKRGLVESVTMDLFTATSTLKFVYMYFQGVKTTPPTLEEALKSAIKLEERLSAFHMDCVGIFSVKMQQELFRSMMAADNGHIESLRRVYRKISGVN